MLSELGRRLAMLLRRRKFDSDLDEEMRLHRELREREEIARGLSPEEAHYAALRRFGNDLLLREESRDIWNWKCPPGWHTYTAMCASPAALPKRRRYLLVYCVAARYY